MLNLGAQKRHHKEIEHYAQDNASMDGLVQQLYIKTYEIQVPR